MSMSSLENVSHNSKSILSKFSTLYSFSLTTLIRVIKSHHLSRFICKKLVDYIGDGAPHPPWMVMIQFSVKYIAC